MSEAGSRMEVCPYCKKPFKRLKSHLPYCKMIEPTIPADQQAHLSQPAIHSPAKKDTRPARVTAKAKRMLEMKEKSKTKRISDTPEWTAASFPLRVVCLKRADTTNAEKEIQAQNQLSFQALKHTEPETTLRRRMTPPSFVSDATSPKRELARDGPESRISPCHPSETEAPSLVDSMAHSLSNQNRTYSSVLPNDKPATCANLKLDTVDPQRQGLLKLLDVPTNNFQSPKILSSGIQKIELRSVLTKESCSTGGGDLPGVSPNQEKENQEKEPGLGVELFRTKGDGQKSVSPAERQEWASLGHGYKNSATGSSATRAKPQDEEPLPNLLAPPKAAYSMLHSVAESGHQSLASQTVKSLQEEKAQFSGHNEVTAVTLLMESKEKALLEPKSACQHQAPKAGYPTVSYSAQHAVSKVSLISHITADSKAPPSSVGLEWFPELYPGYVGLGVLPRRSQHWNSVAQMPPPAMSQGRSVSQVSWLERSSTDSRNLEPWTRLTTSTSPVMSLLGAVHKGWMRCNTTIKKSGVGGLSMLFTGCFILCCNWSFRHLKLQRWRKS